MLCETMLLEGKRSFQLRGFIQGFSYAQESMWGWGRVKSVIGRIFVRGGEWLPRGEDAGLWRLGWTRRCGREQMTGRGCGFGDVSEVEGKCQCGISEQVSLRSKTCG